jgi:Zinc finger, C3HC4 type (RING finger)
MEPAYPNVDIAAELLSVHTSECSFHAADPASLDLRTNWWLFQKNAYSRKPQINVILSIFNTSMMFVGFFLYLVTWWKPIFLLPIVTDILLNCLALYLYVRFPLIFHVPHNSSKRVIFREARFLVLKLAVLILMYFSFQEFRSIPLCVSMLTILLTIVVLDFRRWYDIVYDSVFNLMGMATLMLAYFKLVGEIPITWNQVLILYYVTAWGVAIIFVIELVIFVLLILIEVTTRARGISLKVALLNAILIWNFFFFALTYFEIYEFVTERSSEESLYKLKLILLSSVAYFIIHGAVVVVYHENLNKVGSGATEGEDVLEHKKGLNYILNIMKTTPTYFVPNPEKSRVASPDRDLSQNPQKAAVTKAGGESEDSDEDSENNQDHMCIICYEHQANCVIFPCLHSGTCRDCSITVLKKDKKCMICRVWIEKICVTQQVDKENYKVVEELTMIGSTSKKSQRSNISSLPSMNTPQNVHFRHSTGNMLTIPQRNHA